MRWEDLKTSYCRDAEEDTFLDIHSEGKSLKSITRNFPHGEPKSSDGSEVDPRMVVRDDIQRLYAEFGAELTSPKVTTNLQIPCSPIS